MCAITSCSVLKYESLAFFNLHHISDHCIHITHLKCKRCIVTLWVIFEEKRILHTGKYDMTVIFLIQDAHILLLHKQVISLITVTF